MKKQELNSRIGSFSAWAYGFGCAVGWGAFMMPGNIFLPEAGPLGSLIGIIIAALVIFLIAKATSYMAGKFPKEAGIHVYIAHILGADHGFLSAWATLLAYLSILWANSTAIILLVRDIWGDVLQFGFHYVIAGYDVYFGEILLTVVIVLIFGSLAIFGKVLVRVFHIILAVLHIGLITALFIGIFAGGHHSETFGFANVDLPGGVQIFNIVMLAPWMYVGFEAFMYMFNSGGRKAKDANKITIISIITIAVAYILPVLIPVFAMPEGFSSWEAYIAASSAGDGLFSLPVFYSTYYVLGDTGLYLLVICIFSAIATSIFGLFRATGRLLVSMSEEELMPKKVGKLYKNGEPYIGIIIIMCISAIVLFFGRTAVGWIVDITTITATIVYVYCMVGCLKLTQKDNSTTTGIKIVAILGMVISAVSFLFLLIPNIFSENKIASESYFILALWSLLGLVYYLYVYRHDEKGLYGKSTVMWMLMAFLIFFSLVMWIRQRSVDYINDIERWQKDSLSDYMGENAVIEMVVVAIVLVTLFSLFSLLLKRQRESDKKAIEFESKSEAKTAFLFNMSHDIRTPMNAILGFTDLALLDTSNEEKMKDYLHKIKNSGNHLLSLINDILEMSRIESGKLEIVEKPEDLELIFSNIYSIMKGQADAKGHSFKIDISNIKNKYVYIDRLRFSQVLLNLISNAIKYTQDNGNILVTMTETPSNEDSSSYKISVKDDGFGMSEEFAARIFDEFERENKDATQGIQGTGLGMAITKSIVDIMDGSIEVKTKENEGSEFIIDFKLRKASEEDVKKVNHKEDITEADFKGKRVLLADDMEINREIAVAILELYEFEVVEAVDGQDALSKVVSHPAGYFDLVFLDIQMPRLNGYETAMAIRNISDKSKASVPIIAMTANAFESDIEDAKNAGMNGHVAKPIDQEKLVEEIKKSL